MDYLKRMAEINKKRIVAAQSNDAKKYYLLCNESGVLPELEELYQRGMAEAENIKIGSVKEGGLEKTVRKQRKIKPITQEQVQFLRDYESARFGEEYLLRRYFKRFGKGEKQDLSRYGKKKIESIASHLYDTYKEKEERQLDNQ